jgi:hypothetical protein
VTRSATPSKGPQLKPSKFQSLRTYALTKSQNSALINMSGLLSRYLTMRKTTKPSTAKCNAEKYILFLLLEPKFGGCNRLAEILGDVSHDSINRFLLRERYEPKDLFEIAQNIIAFLTKMRYNNSSA